MSNLPGYSLSQSNLRTIFLNRIIQAVISNQSWHKKVKCLCLWRSKLIQYWKKKSFPFFHLFSSTFCTSHSFTLIIYSNYQKVGWNVLLELMEKQLCLMLGTKFNSRCYASPLVFNWISRIGTSWGSCKNVDSGSVGLEKVLSIWISSKVNLTGWPFDYTLSIESIEPCLYIEITREL